jgi:2-keto-4-pentenoate hydratase/2-oxohepta-3-ene-1,7-dioic acid hydratase in catechol pathway
MKYCTFSVGNENKQRIGAASKDFVVDLEQAAAGKWSGAFPVSLLALIQAGPDAWKRANEIAANAFTGKPASATYALDKVTLHAPIPRPTKNVFCVGLNYAKHAQESSAARGKPVKLPEVPVFFSKSPNTVNGPFDDVPWERRATSEVDYEVELGVVIGSTGKNIARADALKHVFGYTVINDVSARDAQMKHGQFFKGKSMDGFCPMGPVIVTADEFGDPQNKALACRVNGDQRQNSNTSDMIFAVNAIIEWLSLGLTLEPGDVIATGTPEGVGLGRTPPEYLKDGDVVEAEVEGIGTIRNKIRAL